MSLVRLSAALSDRYRVERELGQGGMATVYLAHDLRHDRDVAIKVLHADLGAALGGERFLTEIRTTARLQHPHILPLLDSGEADGLLYYVMPLVTGETLRARLEREQQLPVADAVRIAREVADALGHAHGLGVIHRDIKPENILLQGGHALVADFGIALAVQSAGGARMTQTGLSLGTPQYMSPEQAMGERAIDARSDIYALGAVTYEMLVGEPPFTGPNVQAIVARLITEAPRPLAVQRKAVPDHVESAVLRAIEKLPADRFATAAEFAAALRGEGTANHSTAHVARRLPAGDRRWRTVSAALGATTLGLAAVAVWALARAPVAAGPSVYDVATPDSARVSFINSDTRMLTYGAIVRGMSIAPDGSFLVYVALHADSTSGLWYRSLLTDETRPIAGTAGSSVPRISPDGSQLAYLDNSDVRVVPLAGGEPRRVATLLQGSVLDWTSPAEILAIDTDGDRAFWINPGGGEPREKPIVRCPQGIWSATLGEMLCSFNGAASTINLDTRETHQIRTVQADGTPGGPLTGSGFRLVEGRYLVFISADGVLSAARFDPETHLAQRPVALVTGVRREALGEAQYDVAPNGTLVFAPGIDATVGRLVHRLSGGTPQPLPIEPANFQRYSLSHDGRWLAAAVQRAGLNELRIYDLRTGQHTVWQRAEIIRHPVWSPDGTTMLFAARTGDTWSLLRGTPGGGTAPDTLARFSVQGAAFDPIAYLDDTTAIAQDWNNATVARFNPRAASATIDTILTGARFPSVSPNRRLVAYQTGTDSRIVVTSFPVPGRRWQVASQGVEPLWLSTTTVLYRAGATWYSATVDPQTGEPSGAPVEWGADPRFSDTSGWSNVLSPNGGILYVQGPEQQSPGYFRVIPNWVSQMKRAVDRATQ
jgi:serine/threonine-protein kinase